MIKRWLRSIRKKPKSSRDNIALSISASVTAIVFVVWLYHAPARLASIENRHDQLSEIKNDDSPSLPNFFDSFREQVASVKETISVELATSTEDDVSSIINTPPDFSNSSTEGSYSSSSKYTWQNRGSDDQTTSSNTASQDDAPMEREIRIKASETSAPSSTTNSPPNGE